MVLERPWESLDKLKAKSDRRKSYWQRSAKSLPRLRGRSNLIRPMSVQPDQQLVKPEPQLRVEINNRQIGGGNQG